MDELRELDDNELDEVFGGTFVAFDINNFSPNLGDQANFVGAVNNQTSNLGNQVGVQF